MCFFSCSFFQTVYTSTAYSEVLHGDKCIRNGIIKTSTQPRQYSGGQCGRCGGAALLPSGIILAFILLRGWCKQSGYHIQISRVIINIHVSLLAFIILVTTPSYLHKNVLHLRAGQVI
jgi:hypothetical protein